MQRTCGCGPRARHCWPGCGRLWWTRARRAKRSAPSSCSRRARRRGSAGTQPSCRRTRRSADPGTACTPLRSETDLGTRSRRSGQRAPACRSRCAAGGHQGQGQSVPNGPNISPGSECMPPGSAQAVSASPAAAPQQPAARTRPRGTRGRPLGWGSAHDPSSKPCSAREPCTHGSHRRSRGIRRRD